MYIYIRKMFPNDANGNQISFKKEVAAHFFNAPEEFMRKESNISIHIFHFNNKKAFTDIELQPATDFRFSTRLNSFLSENGEEIEKIIIFIFSEFHNRITASKVISYLEFVFFVSSIYIRVTVRRH